MKKPEYEILIKFFEGDCTEAEYSEVTRWAESSSENRKEFELLKKIYNTPAVSQQDPDVDSAYNKVLGRINNLPAEDSAKIISNDSESSGWSLNKILFNPVYLKAALFLIGSMIVLYFIFNPGYKENYQVVTVPNGEQKELTLPDGSTAILDAGSTIMYAESFGSGSREVQLEGEGFFDVVSNPEAPFSIVTNEARVTVLGTRFNLRAWKNSAAAILAVEEGRVSFANNAGEVKNEVILSGGQVSAIERGAPPSDPENMDINEFTSWQNREMYFQGVELSEVLNQLQRWYDVRFLLPDKSYYSSKITVNIRNTPLEDNLDVLSLVMDFTYEIEGSLISFSPTSQ